MKKINILSSYNNFHFVGIGGVSMSGLAKYCLALNKSVSGSDKNETALINLKKIGIKTYPFHDEKNVEKAQVVVYSSAISDDNPEIIYAKKHDLVLLKRSELLGEIMSDFTHSVGISGSHGKTTATAMLSKILIDAKLSPTVFLGGTSNQVDNFVLGNSKYFIAEACEFKRNFLDLSPYIAVVLNIDNDHLDSFGSLDSEIRCFSKFVENRLSIINADDPYCDKIRTTSSLSFGIKNSASFMATDITSNSGFYSFIPQIYSKREKRVFLKIQGYHNIYNALSAIAVAITFNIPFDTIKKSLESFSGVDRRNEFLGTINNSKIYADYAHHPSEIKAMLKLFNENDLVIFQPHTYSRTKNLMSDFIDALGNLKHLIIYKTYPAREDFDLHGDGKTLYYNIKIANASVKYADNDLELNKFVVDFCKSDNSKVIFLGAGNIYDLAKKIVDENSCKK